MANLEFKLEYHKNTNGPSDEGVFVHLKTEIPNYLSLISKEAYFRGQGTTSELATSLFSIPGVVRLALQSHRVYIEKSPIFIWEEILGPTMVILMTATECDGLSELLGSGITLETNNDRRGFS